MQNIEQLKQKFLEAVSKVLNEDYNLILNTTDAMMNKTENAKDYYKQLTDKCIDKLDMSKEELDILIPHLSEISKDIAKQVLLRLNKKS